MRKDHDSTIETPEPQTAQAAQESPAPTANAAHGKSEGPKAPEGAAAGATGAAAGAASGAPGQSDAPKPPHGAHSLSRHGHDGPIPPKGDSTERDFSNPHHMGFMRFIMLLIALQTFFTLVGLASSAKNDIAFDFNSVLMFVDLLFNAVLFWLMWQRRAHTRAIAITFSVLNIIAGTSYNIATGNFSLSSQLLLSFCDIVVICYFSTSRRAKAVLVRPWTQAEREKAVERDIELFAPRKREYWRNLAIYFCVFSVVGHWMEAGYCTLIRFGLLPGVYDPTSQIWSDWLYPFMVYGIGFDVCALLFFPFKNWLQKKIHVRGIPFAISFVVNAAVCAGIELVMGLMLNQPLPDGSLPLWDYRDMAFNFMGQICLANAIAFGVAASIVTWFVYPALEGLLRRAPKDTVRIASVVVFVGFAFLLALYYINLATIEKDVENITGAGAAATSTQDTGESSEAQRLAGELETQASGDSGTQDTAPAAAGGTDTSGADSDAGSDSTSGASLSIDLSTTGSGGEERGDESGGSNGADAGGTSGETSGAQ